MARVGQFAVTKTTLPGGGVRVQVVGELDLASAPTLERALSESGFENRLVVDLMECAFVDSSAVRVLVAGARDSQAAGGTISLVATDPGILRVLEISGVDTLLPVRPTLEDAH